LKYRRQTWFTQSAGQLPGQGDRSLVRRAYRPYFLALLVATTFFYQLDRNVIFVTQELIKTEFRLSDTELGMVTGLAFGLANGLAGFPLGWLNDRVNRAKLLSICVTVWSAMTATCGLAGNFLALCGARFAVGAAESGGTPAIFSILTDLYPPHLRSSKMGIVSAGYGAGTIVSALAGSYVAAHFGWRAAFLLCGAPGLVLAFLLVTTVREPPRTRGTDQVPVPARAVPMAIGQLLVQPGLRVIFLGTALTSMISTGVYSWWASFIIRVHHVDLPTVGLMSTIALGVCGMIGGVAAGYAADWARRRTPGGPLLVMSATSLINLVFATLAIWTSSTGMMFGALCFAGATMSAYVAPRGAALSELAPGHMRGMAFTIPTVITSLVGVAMGPVAIGGIADMVAASGLKVEPLRVGMSCMLLLHVPVACIYIMTARRMAQRAASDQTARPFSSAV